MSDILALLAARRNAPPRLYFKHPAVDFAELLDAYAGMEGQVIELATPEHMATAAEMLYPGINTGSANEEWITSDGKRMKIGDMAPQHLVHTLAKIMREAKRGKAWKCNRAGALRFYDNVYGLELG